MLFSTPGRPGRFLPTRLLACLVLFAGFCARPGQAQTPPDPTPETTVSRDQISYQGAADLRFRETEQETRGSYIAATRLQADWIRRFPDTGAIQSGARVQIYLEPENARGTTVNRLRASELYGFFDFTLPGVSGRVKAGQFVLPFGLLATYDTPLQPIQPLYEKSLGLRVDAGLMVAGEYGPYRYEASLTTGRGPNAFRFDANKVWTFRLSRTVETEVGVFIVGGSLLSGNLPVTEFDTELPPSGTSDASRFVDKTRFAGDGTYLFGPFLLRGELVFGGDDDEPVWGYFAEGNYQVLPRLTLVAYRKQWNFPEKPMSSSTTGLGANYDFGGGFLLRALYEFQRDVSLPTEASSGVTKRFTLQTRLNF